MLLPFQERVVQEHKEIAEKLISLRSFMGSDNWIDVPMNQKYWMKNQEIYMQEYRDVLAERIADFYSLAQ